MMTGPVRTEDIRELPTPELALLLLRQVAKGSDPNINSTLRSAQQAYDQAGEPDPQLLLERLADAWAWLEAHGLIGPHPINTESVWKRVTEQGRAIAEDENALTVLWASERLAGELVPALTGNVRAIFNLGDYETASFAAMKVVEVEVRRLGGFPDSLLGVKLMQQAFAPDGGPLADASADKGEQVAVMNLFAGAIGTFKNPSSHRTVTFGDPVEAAEVVQTADLLLRLLRRVEQRLLDAGTGGAAPGTSSGA